MIKTVSPELEAAQLFVVSLMVQSSCVYGAGLYGALAERGEGRDIDLVVVTSSEVAERFHLAVGSSYHEYTNLQKAQKVAELVGVQFDQLTKFFGEFWTPELIDLIPLPLGWMNEIRALGQRYGLINTGRYGKDFLETVREQYRPFDPARGRFLL